VYRVLTNNSKIEFVVHLLNSLGLKEAAPFTFLWTRVYLTNMKVLCIGRWVSLVCHCLKPPLTSCVLHSYFLLSTVVRCLWLDNMAVVFTTYRLMKTWSVLKNEMRFLRKSFSFAKTSQPVCLLLLQLLAARPVTAVMYIHQWQLTRLSMARYLLNTLIYCREWNEEHLLGWITSISPVI